MVPQERGRRRIEPFPVGFTEFLVPKPLISKYWINHINIYFNFINLYCIIFSLNKYSNPINYENIFKKLNSKIKFVKKKNQEIFFYSAVILGYRLNGHLVFLAADLGLLYQRGWIQEVFCNPS